MIKTETGDLFFGHRQSFLNSPLPPRVGRQVSFTPLPPGMVGKMGRATEIEILPSRVPSPSPSPTIFVTRTERGTQLVLRAGSAERILSELNV
jgi:hypothetical protein